MTEEMSATFVGGLDRTCPNGHEVGPEDMVCNRCARLVSRSDERVLCPNGHSVALGAAFCDQCGAAIDEQGQQKEMSGLMAGESATTVVDPGAVTADATKQHQPPDPSNSVPSSIAPVPLTRYQLPSRALLDTGVVTPSEYPIATSRTRGSGRFRQNRVPIILGSVLCLLLIGAGVLASQEHSTANKWMHADQQEVRKNTALSSQVSSLNGQVSNLNGQMSNLQSQLSAVANQKAKALDQNAVLTSALQDASSVAADLNTCVNDTQVVLTDISNALSGGFVPASAESDATSAGQFCGQAQAEESALQVVLAGA